jgi:hypothetical protein
MPDLQRRVLVPPGLPHVPPPGFGITYVLAEGGCGELRYAGVTCQAARDRLAGHVSSARHGRGTNRRLNAWIRDVARRGGTLEMRVLSHHAAGPELKAAEIALIADLRRRSGERLLNLGPGGETAPVGRLVTAEERERRRLARRTLERDPRYRRLQSRVSSLRRHPPAAYDALLRSFAARGLDETREALCCEHRLPTNALTVLLSGQANGLVVEPDLLARAREVDARLQARTAAARGRMRAAAEACLAAPPERTIAEVAAEHGLSGRRLAEAIRRRQCGIDDALSAAIRARSKARSRSRGRELGRRARRVDWAQLVELLTEYAHGAPGLTLAEIGRKLGVTQSHLSHVICGDKGSPLPRHLAQACRRRARAARLAALRGGRPRR